MKIDKLIIYVDGAARGNPGPAAIGAVLADPQGRPVARLSERIGTATNNQAEYRALIAALEKAISLGAHHVEVRSDSELLVKQMNGQYRVKNPGLRLLYQQVEQLRQRLEAFVIWHVPRQQNAEADALANAALYRRS